MSTLLFSVFVFSSCDKPDETNLYGYTVEFKMSQNSDVKAIDDVLEPRLNKVYVITYAEAEAEWNSFLNAVDESAVVIEGDDYYTVTFTQYKEEGYELLPGKTVGTKTWEN